MKPAIFALVAMLALPALALAQQGTATVEVGFSPGPTAENLVLATIRSAHSEILCAIYDFTSRAIARALLREVRKGVRVSIVADAREAATRYSDLRALAREGVAVRLDDRYAAMHDKFLVVDNRTTETGSFNFSYSAYRRNAENVIVVRDDPQVAAAYASQWRMLWEQSTPLR